MDKLAPLVAVPDDQKPIAAPSDFLCPWCWHYRPQSMLAATIGPRKRRQCTTCRDRIRKTKRMKESMK